MVKYVNDLREYSIQLVGNKPNGRCLSLLRRTVGAIVVFVTVTSTAIGVISSPFSAVSTAQAAISSKKIHETHPTSRSVSQDTSGQIADRVTPTVDSSENVKEPQHTAPTNEEPTGSNGDLGNNELTDDAPQTEHTTEDDTAAQSGDQQSGATHPTETEETAEPMPRSATSRPAAEAANERPSGSQGQGNTVLTSTGELYRILPQTYNSSSSDTMQPLPFIPLLDKNDNAYRDGNRYKAIKNYNRNFNGLGVAPDGTRYVIENGLDNHACGRQTTRYRVWKFPLGATQWSLHKTWSMGTNFGAEVNISSVSITQGRAKLQGMCFQGGGVDPVSGNYFVGGVVTRSNTNKGDSAYYIFEIDKDSGTVTPRGWLRIDEDAQSQGDIIFDTAGNMIIGNGSSLGGRPSLVQYTISQSQLRSTNDVNTRILDTAPPKYIPLPGFANFSAPTGISISPEGNLFFSAHTHRLSDAFIYEVASDGVKRVQKLPDMIEMTGKCSPTPKDPIWLRYAVRRQPYYNPESGTGGWSCENGVLPLGLWTKEITDIDGYRDPAWITLQKNVEKRNGTDQFTLKVEAQNFGTWSATTRGQTEGIQAEKVGRQAVPVDTELKISETITTDRSLENDYTVSLQCVGEDGNEATTSAVTVSGKTASATVTVPADPARINPASDITCTFTNKYKEKGSIELTKLDSTGNASSTLPGAVFELYVDGNGDGKYQADQDTLVPDTRRTTNASGQVTWTGLEYGKYLAKEVTPPAGYTPTAAEADGYHAVVLDAPVKRDQMLNDPVKGTVTWKKVDDATPANPLGGSEWTLTAPNGRNYTITDCVKATCATPHAGAFADTDPAQGTLSLSGQLPWGTYTLKESKAPTGYVLSNRTLKFTIDKNTLDVNFTDPVVNHKATSPTLPLTGGLSADVFRLSALVVFGFAALLVSHLRRWRKAVS